MKTRTTALVGAAAISLACLTGCSDDADSGDADGSATRSASAVPCDGEILLDQVVQGSTLKRFDCTEDDGVTWGALEVEEGPTVFFLSWDPTSKAWFPMTGEEGCADPALGVPQELVDSYCAAD